MTEQPSFHPHPPIDSETHLTEAESQHLFQQLRRKEGTWVDWGHACQHLQKNGYSSNQIFDETGFEPIQQNQVIVAAQVYDSLLKGAASPSVQTYFSKKGSDILYEFRVLNQTQRVAAAELVLTKQMDQPAAHDLARAIKDLGRLSALPQGFSHHPGDALAYQCWKQARGRSDLQERSRLIAKGLQFAESESARSKLEALLTDFTVIPERRAPQLPLYRQQKEEDLPRLIPVVGTLPLSCEALAQIPASIHKQGTFPIAAGNQPHGWIALPGWKVVLSARDPIAFLARSDQMPQTLEGGVETLLVVVDRGVTDWDPSTYFLVDQGGEIALAWFETEPTQPLLGTVRVILRPQKVFDEDALTKDWHLDAFDE